MERVIAVGVHTRTHDPYTIEKMEEFTQLVEAAGAEVVMIVEQTVRQIHPSVVLGKGKVEEISSLVELHEIDAVCFNVELTGSQIRNLEKELSCKVIDRTNVILDIFAQRATEREGKLQVKLAQLSYRLPRLVGFRSYLSRTGGGIGTRGPGEQQLDTDRRHIEREMQQIKNALATTEKTRRIKSGRRKRSDTPIVALLGYTNAGKSTVMNGLLSLGSSSAEKLVSAKNQLFETLNTAHRRATLPNGADYILMDTVGFVSDLPTEFIAAFQSTLEEVMNADLIVHVIDGSSETLEIQIRTTLEMLKQLEALHIPRLTLINKIDRIVGDTSIAEDRLPNKMWVSARDPLDIERIASQIENHLFPDGPFHWMIPFSAEADYRRAFSELRPRSMEYTEEGTTFRAFLSRSAEEKLKRWLEERGLTP